MKKIISLFFATLFVSSTALTFAGNKCACEVIIPGKDLSKRPFVMPKGLKDGEDYLSKTIIFKVKPNYRQNCKTYSVDNILSVQDFLSVIDAQNLAKIYPKHEPPAQERNMVGQKLVDLSLIYSFKYTADMNLEKVINQMKSLGYFEFVEPWYIQKTQLVPNDPLYSNSGQYHVKGNVTGSLNCQQAWDITQGSASTVIGIVDTGTSPTAPDLAPNLLPGWDVAMNDNDPTYVNNNHGTHVCGDASARTNNGVGVASPGFTCKLLPVKAQTDGSVYITHGYAGITWAADNGAKIINCSWGGGGGGAYGQTIIDYAVINKNCVIFASAGNGGLDQELYPSSFNNVFRVASTTSTDSKSGFSDYGCDVDFGSPGSNIYSTTSSSGYGSMSGTSMASPVAAGAAGLVQSNFNYTNATQIGEKLKQTCDPYAGASTLSLYNAGKLGKGRIDVHRALTVAAKSIVMNPITITDGNDDVFMPGEILSISGTFINYLDPSSSSASATLTVVSGPGTVTGGNPYAIGALATLGTTTNTAAPFTVSIGGAAAVNDIIQLKLTTTDGAFTNSVCVSVVVNEDYINITINDVFISITSKGRIGYNNDGQAQGLGFEYQLPAPENLLYEMSLMIGTSATKVSDMFRETSGGNTDFGSMTRAYIVNPTSFSNFDVAGKFNDAPSPSAVPVEVRHHAYAWNTAPYRKFIIVKYKIKNTGASTLNNLYAGLVADWDITNAGNNKAAYDAVNKIGYVWHTGAGGKYAAFKLLSKTGGTTHYVLDLVAGGNGGIDPATDFTTAEKYQALSTNRNTDGFGATGGDVMDCLSTGPFTVIAGDSVEVAFAIIGGDNLVDVQASACAAQNKYDNGCTVGINDPENDDFWIWSYPNPATNSVMINYNISGSDNASIRIMNAVGEVVMTFDNITPGKNELNVDVSKLSAGNYFYQLKAGEATLTKKFTVVK